MIPWPTRSSTKSDRPSRHARRLTAFPRFDPMPLTKDDPMSDTQPSPNGRHLIAGQWTDSPSHFHNTPLSGAPRAFAQGTPDLVDRAARAAENALASYAATSRDLRAGFLE